MKRASLGRWRAPRARWTYLGALMVPGACVWLHGGCASCEDAPTTQGAPTTHADVVGEEPVEHPRSLPHLEVGYSALRISLPIFVAADRDLFRKHGLDVELKRFETAQPLVEEALDGRVLAAGYAALPIIVTAASHGDAAVRLTTAMVEDEAHPVSYLLRRRGDQRIRTIGDLRGKRVGILPTVAYQRWIEAILGGADLAAADAAIIPLAPAQQLGALDGSGVDALFTNDPMATAALQSGVAESFGPLAPVAQLLDDEMVFGSFLVHPSLIRERPTAVTSLIAALDEAIALIAADQAAARRTMTAYVRENERSYIDAYPPSRYLPSAAFDDARLGREFGHLVALKIISAQTAGFTGLIGNSTITNMRTVGSLSTDRGSQTGPAGAPGDRGPGAN